MLAGHVWTQPDKGSVGGGEGDDCRTSQLHILLSGLSLTGVYHIIMWHLFNGQQSFVAQG